MVMKPPKLAPAIQGEKPTEKISPVMNQSQASAPPPTILPVAVEVNDDEMTKSEWN
jgi:hypothetical protein